MRIHSASMRLLLLIIIIIIMIVVDVSVLVRVLRDLLLYIVYLWLFPMPKNLEENALIECAG